MKIDIDKLSEKELLDLNHRIVERLRFLEQSRARNKMLEFSIGQRVAFMPNEDLVITGILTKYNLKTVTVIDDDGKRWNVSPSLLIDAETTGKTNKSDKVLPFRKK